MKDEIARKLHGLFDDLNDATAAIPDRIQQSFEKLA